MARFLWTQKQNFGPRARWGHAMIYDTARQRTLLFGGHFLGEDEFAGDTWEWDGQTWVQASDIGPTARYNHNMVYDSIRERIVLYGGRVVKDGMATKETWEWNGIEWIQVADTGPLFQNGSTAMGYDRGRERIVLFGHLDPTRGETWEWDGNEWTQKDDTGPSARYFATLAFDSGRQCAVLFGGFDSTKGYLGDTWEWNGALWKQRADFGPVGRSEHAMVFDDDRNRVVLFGGITKAEVGAALQLLGDTWEWDGNRWIQRLNMGPQNRSNHALAYDTGRKRIIMFGGKAFNIVFGDTWEFGELPSN